MTHVYKAATKLLLAVALLAVPAIAVAQQIAPPKIPHEKYTLQNGLTVILHVDHTTPIVAVNIWYHVGSKNERRGRTGFAHLFEHMMFQGSKNHDTDYFKALESVGATDLNGTTNNDRTNYFQNVPSHALERTLWVEADRMCCLLPSMTQERLDNQREVVKNERRQGIDNQPYGLVDERMDAAMYPAHHPYSWPVIGYMDDLTAASKQDVENFFKEYYTPNNCTLVIAGDIDVAKTKAMVEKYFGPIPPGPPVGRAKEWVPELEREVRLYMDDQVNLPRLYIAWHSPARFTAGEANLDLLSSIMGRGKTSRLYKRLVYDLKLAQDVSVSNPAQEIGGKFTITVTAAPGKTLDEIEPLVWEEVEKVKAAPPSEEEVERARTSLLAGLLRGLERIGGFGGKSDLLANYQTFLGDTNFLEKDFARYYAVTPATIHAAARRWLHDGRAVMRVTPMPKYAAGNEAPGFDRSKMPSLGDAANLALPSLPRAKLSNGLE
ncbi:MAG TPA: pitrilysin family protein, partial [Blastocatellia bacterium]|nr:pitrilysin family protein [Blastocatellia bacterium]